MYWIADILAFALRRVARYRRNVVRKNLSEAFPARSARQLRDIEKGYYRFLADTFLETMSLATMGEKKIRRKMRFEGMEALNTALENGRNVAIFLGHYGNWEWISSMPLWLTPKCHPCQLYKPLRNKFAEKLYLRLRGRFGAVSVPKDDALRVLRDDIRAARPNITGYIADQSPRYPNIHHFVDFLNHDTPVFTGSERMARIAKAACFYARVSSPRRGRWVCTMLPICDDASRLKPFEVTDAYYSLLEADIERQPRFWLWSHRRWRRSRKEFLEIYGPDAEKRLAKP